MFIKMLLYPRWSSIFDNGVSASTDKVMNYLKEKCKGALRGRRVERWKGQARLAASGKKRNDRKVFSTETIIA